MPSSTPSQADFASAIMKVYTNIEKIEALVTNPHWTADRRWRIQRLASEAKNLLDVPR